MYAHEIVTLSRKRKNDMKKVKDFKVGDLLYYMHGVQVKKLTISKIVELVSDEQRVAIYCNEISYLLGAWKCEASFNIMGDRVFIDKKEALLTLYELRAALEKSISLMEKA